jgi:hypothetical protein
MLANLLSNKWVLYGGAAVAVLGGMYLLSGGSGASEGEGDPYAGGLFPMATMPVAIPSSSQGGGGDAGLDALIALESKKTDYGREISLAEIGAGLQAMLASTGANLTLGLAQADALNMMAFADVYSNASKLLSVDTIGSVAGNFNYNGKTFSFDAARFQTRYPQDNQNTLNALTGYNAINRGTPVNAGTNNSLASNAGQLSVTGAPSSQSAGRSIVPVASHAPRVGTNAATVSSVGAGAAASAYRARVADRLRL